MPEYERDLRTIKEEIRARCDIVEIISTYTQLKKAGKNFTGLCPFHADTRPSFTVTPQFQSYRCWSCGEKGDVFTFIQKKENLDFIEVLERLAKRYGIPFERKGVSKEQTTEREQMLDLNLLATRFYQDRLSKSADAQAYLTQRAILKSTQEQWDLGFAPPDWEGLVYHLQQRRADLRLAAKMGLIKTRQQEGSGYYDAFRNRLMFPIHDLQGRVIGFGGRRMSEDKNEAKYLNSEQSLLFNKSATLYGMFFARQKISSTNSPVFVEGYVDVITTHQAGFTQCVATLGTALTEEHARMLARYNPRALLCYDGDEAGIKATLRGAEVWESIGVAGAEARVVRLPEGEDPDSLLRNGEISAFQAALDNAVPRVDFQIELALKRHDLHTEEGRSDALSEVIPILASVPSLTQRDRYASKLASLHPSGSFDLKRAISAILADVEMHLRQTRNGKSPRAQGYPLTEQANREPLNEQPPPPTYRPPNPQQWGQWDPQTRNVVRKGDQFDPGYGRGAPGLGNRYGGNGEWRGGKREKRGPVGDPTPPPLVTPAMTGVEKAERQILRALFTAEWRSSILSRLPPDTLITTQGKRLFALIARTPAGEDGNIDPLLLLRQAETEEETETTVSAAEPPTGEADRSLLEEAGTPAEADPYAEPDPYAETDGPTVADLSSEEDPYAEPDPYAADESDPSSGMALSGAWEGLLPPVEGKRETETDHHASASSRPSRKQEAFAGREEEPPKKSSASRNFAKMSEYIREVLEDSLSVVSNEPLSDAVINDCIRRLQKHREAQAKHELEEKIRRDDLSAEERRAVQEQYLKLMRETRGSPPAANED
jgi:DNA primase